MTVSQPRLTMHIGFMLTLYGIVPLSLLIVLADALLFHHQLRDALPTDPHRWAWFALIFNFPHIMASHIAFADREYLRFYKKRLWQAYLAAIAICAVVPFLFGSQTFLIVAATFTMYHVIRQQFGITLLLLGIKPTRLFVIWRMLAVIGGSILYLVMFGGYVSWQHSELVKLTGIFLTLISCIFGVGSLMQAIRITHNKPLAIYYMGANIVMLVGVAIIFAMGYSFFGILVPRFIHDVTAMAIYSVHDKNRNTAETRNAIYSLMRWLRLSPLVLCAPLGILLAFVFSGAGTGNSVGFILIGIFSFAHYILEGHVWKHGTPHRREVAFITG